MDKQLSLLKSEKINSNWFDEFCLNFGLDEKSAWPDHFGRIIKELSIPKKKINVLSLFSGAGGLDIGFHDAGFNIIDCVEIEENFIETLKLNKKKYYFKKLSCIDIKNYESPSEKVDFIIGGPPCQTFSAAGARANGVSGTDDDRGNLFQEYVRILKEVKPKGFLFENVYRIVGAQGGKPWEEIQKAFRKVGYKLFFRILDFADYGVPQHRERLIIVGLKEGEFLFPRPSHGPDSNNNKSYYNAGKAVLNIKKTKDHAKFNGHHSHLLELIPPGLNYSFFTEKLGHPEPIFSWRSKFSDYLYKADPKKPVRTIKANGGQYTGPFSWENRHFTIDELKRLQTFPDNYTINGNNRIVLRQIGNSVPPQASRLLSLAVLDQVFGFELPFRIDYLSPHIKLGFRSRRSLLTKHYANIARKCHSKNGRKDKYKIIKSKKSITKKWINDKLTLNKDTDGKGFYFNEIISKDTWKISISESEQKKNIQYIIKIKDLSIFDKLNINQIIFESSTNNPKSLTAIWKYLEQFLNKNNLKDDLVQLFGYYQNTNRNFISMEIENEKLNENKFWLVIKSLTNGLNIGRTLHFERFIDEYNVSKKQLIKILRDIKTLGYDVINQNTNSQINSDHYLIPYAFPSLNEKSVQRFKIL